MSATGGEVEIDWWLISTGDLCRRCSKIGLWWWLHISEYTRNYLLSVKLLFSWICGGESGLPVLFLRHLSSLSYTRNYWIEIKLVNPKVNQSRIFIGRTVSEAPILWPPDAKPTHWKRPWCWERLRAGEVGDRGWDGWMASLTEGAWVWANFRSWWRTGKPGILQSMGSQRVGYNLVTEQQQYWIKYKSVIMNINTNQLTLPVISANVFLAVLSLMNIWKSTMWMGWQVSAPEDSMPK